MTEVLTHEALKAERDALADRVKALAVENGNQRAWINKCSELWDAGCELDDFLGLIPETPATDVALAAIKKQAGIEAVEEAAYSLYGKGYIFDTIMDYATELREAK
ncbi:hypothetical protein [Serratia ureilytica]|uniref:hypothetical protein n=1 Tax=Serratia ureilytica TaxID=300181 RepID=UPI0018D9BBF9|nr:hypothetical protein [Serratia ureilytica]MBH2514845.1 hypothetical protein [Serratia ureilytica]MBH2529718.1 hypothetical protein [Serratia ureilytica]